MTQTYHRYREGDQPVPGYCLTGFLGSGAFGEVWKATGPGETEVALKIINLAGKQGLTEFASIQRVKRIQHPNLIPLHALWLKDDDGHILDPALGFSDSTLPVLPGRDALAQTVASLPEPKELLIAMGLGSQSLHDRLKQCRRKGQPGIPVPQLLDLMEGAARGIDYLNQPIHDLGHGPVAIVHGDIKPQNIMIVGDAAAVCDFGLARAVETLRRTSMSSSGPGTVAYAAPELLKGKPNRHSDEYCLAVSYFELRTGGLPFDESLTAYEVMNLHVQGKLDLSELEEAERDVIARATRVAWEERWNSCLEMVRHLRQACEWEGHLEEEVQLSPGRDIPSTHLQRTGSTGEPTVADVEDRRKRGSNGGNTVRELAKTAGSARITTGSAHRSTARELSIPGDRPTEIRRRVRRLGASSLVVATVCCLAAFFGIKGFRSNADRLDPQQVRGMIEEHLQADRYRAAAELLKDSPHLPADLNTRLQEQIRSQWLERIASRYHADAIDASQAACQEMLATPLFAGDRAARLALARVQARLGNPAAGESLAKIDSPRDLGNAALLLFKTLEMAIVAEPPAEADIRRTIHILHGLQTYNDLKTMASDPRSPWALTNWERSKAEAYFNQAMQQAQTLVDQQPGQATAELLALLVQFRKSPEGILLTAANQIGERNFVEARRSLRDPSLSEVASNPQLAAELEYLATLIEFVDPGATPATVEAKFAPAKKLVAGQVSPAWRRVLCHALTQLSAMVEAYLDPALEIVQVAIETDPTNPELPPLRAKLLTQRLKAQVALVLAPQAPQWTQWREEAELVLAAVAPAEVDPLVTAVWIECLLEQKQQLPANSALSIQDDSESSYVHYVAARALASASRVDWSQVASHLESAVRMETSGPLTAAFRRAAIARTVLYFGLQSREQNLEGSLDLLQANPFKGASDEQKQATAALVYRLVSPARELLIGLAASESLTVNELRGLHVLAIQAAWFRPAPNPQQVRDLAASLIAKVSNEGLGTDAMPVLFVVLKSELAASDAAPLQPAMRLISQFKTSIQYRDPLDEQAAQFYSLVIEPTAARAEKQPNSRDLAEFYGAAGDFIARHRHAKWPFPDKPRRLEEFYARAIDAGQQADDPRLVNYLIGRGTARLDVHPADLNGALADLELATQIQPDFPAALSLKGQALLIRSRQQARFAQRVEDLDLAIEACRAAIATAAANTAAIKDENELAACAIHLSGALVERANFNPSTRHADLAEAVTVARQASAYQQQSYPEYAFAALGNALEDLAWLVKHDAVANYRLALAAFTTAIDHNPLLSNSYCHRGRCCYKAAVESQLSQADLELDRDPRDLAESDLRKSLELNPGWIEAHYYLARLCHDRQQWNEADAHYAAASKLALEQKPVEFVHYVKTWAEFPLSNVNLPAPDRIVECRLRLATLSKLPSQPGDSLEPDKEGKILEAECYRLENQLDEGLALLDTIDVPEPVTPLSGSDVMLLQKRLEFRLRLPESNWKQRDTLTTALTDCLRLQQSQEPLQQALALANRGRAKAKWFRFGMQQVAESSRFRAEAMDDLRAALTRAGDTPESWLWREDLAGLIYTALLSPDPSAQREQLGKEAFRQLSLALESLKRRRDAPSGAIQRLEKYQRQLVDYGKSLKLDFATP